MRYVDKIVEKTVKVPRNVYKDKIIEVEKTVYVDVPVRMDNIITDVVETFTEVRNCVRMKKSEEIPDWSNSLSSFLRMAELFVFINILLIIPIFLLLFLHRQSQTHGHPSDSSRQMRRQWGLGVLLGIILVLSQVGSTKAYPCTLDTHCQYSGCPSAYCWNYYSRGYNCYWNYNGNERNCPDPPVCNAGSFSPDGKNAGGDKACQLCPSGKFQTSTGSSSSIYLNLTVTAFTMTIPVMTWMFSLLHMY